MSKFIVNRSQELASAIKMVVKQSVPAANPSYVTMGVGTPSQRAEGAPISLKVAGSSRNRFLWGTSRFGGSDLIG